MKISALLIVYNEEKYIRRAMENLKDYVDDFVVIDTESTDKTREIAKEYGARIYQMPLVRFDEPYRNMGVAVCKNEWILRTCPDELWTKEALEAMPKLIEKYKETDIFAFRRLDYMDGNDISPEGKTYCLRLHKHNVYYPELIHSEMILDGLKTARAEYVFKHTKTIMEQHLDNRRYLPIYKYLLIKYEKSRLQYVKNYLDSYREIIKSYDENGNNDNYFPDLYKKKGEK